MLVVKSRTTKVVGEVITDNYLYKVNYNLNGEELVNIHCDVYKKLTQEIDTPEGKQNVERTENVGMMFKEAGNKQICLRDGEDTAPHAVVFEQILSEITTLLAPVASIPKITK